MDIKKLNEELSKLIEEAKQEKGLIELRKLIAKNPKLKATVLGYEFSNDDFVSSDEDSLAFNSAELMPKHVLKTLTQICKKLILESSLNLSDVKNSLKNCMKHILHGIEKEDLLHSNSDSLREDGIQALQAIPVLIKELCEALETEEAKALIYFIAETPVFEKALKLADEIRATF